MIVTQGFEVAETEISDLVVQGLLSNRFIAQAYEVAAIAKGEIILQGLLGNMMAQGYLA